MLRISSCVIQRLHRRSEYSTELVTIWSSNGVEVAGAHSPRRAVESGVFVYNRRWRQNERRKVAP